MQLLEVSGAVRHIYIYVIRQLKVKVSNVIPFSAVIRSISVFLQIVKIDSANQAASDSTPQD